MWLSDISVKRPVFATVLSLMLVALGFLSFRDLTVREYPDTVAPTVQVQAAYPGASADIVETRITQVLEGELSGIEGVKTIRSTSRDQQASAHRRIQSDPQSGRSRERRSRSHLARGSTSAGRRRHSRRSPKPTPIRSRSCGSRSTAIRWA